MSFLPFRSPVLQSSSQITKERIFKEALKGGGALAILGSKFFFLQIYNRSWTSSLNGHLMQQIS